VIAQSDGKASGIHMVDNSYAIARFKAKSTTTPIANCPGCKMLETVNMPLGEASARMGAAVSGLLGRYGDSWWMTTCCHGYYTNVAAALRAADASTDKIKLVGADAPPSAYDMIRKGGFEVATLPEPGSLFGYEAMDAVIRAMAGQEPAHFLQPVFHIVKDNVGTEGEKNNEFVPSNDFACPTKLPGRVRARPATRFVSQRLCSGRTSAPWPPRPVRAPSSWRRRKQPVTAERQHIQANRHGGRCASRDRDQGSHQALSQPPSLWMAST
jgi:hypothetical protein